MDDKKIYSSLNSGGDCKNIINYLSNEDKELIMELMIPEGRDKPAELYYP